MTVGRTRFGVQAAPGTSAQEWLDLAPRIEDLGFDALYVADHVGVTPSPFPALAAAAAVTSTLRLGTYVLNCGVHDPLALASAVATLDQLSSGRVVLGLGAGHTPAEWTMSGLAYPAAGERVARLVEMVDVVTALLRGEVVTRHGRHVHLDEAFLAEPRPVQARVPLLVGGNGRAVLELGGREADIVSITGLGRTLADGHRHAVDWDPNATDERVAFVRGAAAGRADADDLVLDALVQHVELTADRDGVAEKLASIDPDLTAAHVIAAPYVLIGTIDQMVEDLVAHESRWGITSYVVRAEAVDVVAEVIERVRR